MTGDEAVDLLGVAFRRFGRAPDGEAARITGIASVRLSLMTGEADDPTPPVTLVVLDDVQVIEALGCIEGLGDRGLGMPPLAHHVGILQRAVAITQHRPD